MMDLKILLEQFSFSTGGFLSKFTRIFAKSTSRSSDFAEGTKNLMRMGQKKYPRMSKML